MFGFGFSFPISTYKSPFLLLSSVVRINVHTNYSIKNILYINFESIETLGILLSKNSKSEFRVHKITTKTQ